MFADFKGCTSKEKVAAKKEISLDLIAEIIKKKELADIDPNFIQKYVDKHNFTINSDKELKQAVKIIRAELRQVYGLYRNSRASKKRDILMHKLAKDPQNNNIVVDILKTHASTKERLPIYTQLYNQTFQITGQPSSLLDLGCGINPFSAIFMKSVPTYHAYDISRGELAQIDDFFSMKSIIGSTKLVDLLNPNMKLPKTDVTFLFKMSDMVDLKKGHKATEELIEKIPAKHVVLSFATKTMSGKRMRAPKRNWVVWLCDRLEYNYHLLEFSNELFYVITK